MKILACIVLILILMFLTACKGEITGITGSVAVNNLGDKKEVATNSDDATGNGEVSGIRVSDWYKSEKYGKDIIDVFNFDDRESTVNITTICYDKDDEILPSNDSEILKIPAKQQWTWIPICPSGTVSYNIDLKKLD